MLSYYVWCIVFDVWWNLSYSVCVWFMWHTGCILRTLYYVPVLCTHSTMKSGKKDWFKTHTHTHSVNWARRVLQEQYLIHTTACWSDFAIIASSSSGIKVCLKTNYTPAHSLPQQFLLTLTVIVCVLFKSCHTYSHSCQVQSGSVTTTSTATL